MNEALERIRQEALERLKEVREEKELEALNASILGRSGSLTGILRTMGQLDKEQRAKLGQASNAVKKELVPSHVAQGKNLGTAICYWKGLLRVHPPYRVLSDDRRLTPQALSAPRYSRRSVQDRHLGF